jgi:NADPH:quinone reductase
MKAIVIVPGEGSDGTLELRDVADPQLADGQLLVRVRASALNRADLSQRRGAATHPTLEARDGEAQIGGLEAAGEVVEAGAGVSRWKAGDRVMGMVGGSFAEYVTFDERLAMPVPERLSWEEAAATPTALLTEHNALVTNAAFRRGESVLIHAAASGVWLMGVQIAKLLGAYPLIGTIASAEQRDVVTGLGLDTPVDFREESFRERVDAVTGGDGVDVVIDHVGGVNLPDNLRCMAVKGRLVSVGRLGPKVGELDLDLLALKQLKLIGVTFRTRTLDEHAEIIRRALEDLGPALEDGRLRPILDRAFPLEDALGAQRYMESNAQIGKIVLNVG